MLDGLKATHSSQRICDFARNNGGLCRKDPVKSLHPVVRVHPVTGERSLFVNDEWITGIHGWKPAETAWLLQYLMDHVSRGHDFQVRLQWKPRTVVMFDNRSTCRTSPPDARVLDVRGRLAGGLTDARDRHRHRRLRWRLREGAPHVPSRQHVREADLRRRGARRRRQRQRQRRV